MDSAESLIISPNLKYLYSPAEVNAVLFLCWNNIEFCDKLIVPNQLNPDKRTTNDIRLLHETFPKRVKAIVVHKKFIVKDTVANIMDVDNFFVEVSSI